jgi:hypothetical protein
MPVKFMTSYREDSAAVFGYYKKLAERAIEQMADQELFAVLDEEMNSIAIIVKHMAGNMRSRFRDFLTTDGEKPDRHRDQEFELVSETTRDDVMRWWESGWAFVFSAVEALRPEDVERTVTIRGEPHTVLQAINRQLAHYAYHVGQIVFLAKHLRSRDWKSLSIPRGKSEEVNRKMSAERKPGSSWPGADQK